VTPELVIGFADEARQGRALAAHLGVPYQPVHTHRFPDGELRLRLPPRLPARVVLLRGLHRPNDRLVELLIAAPAARELGAAELVLICPYLAYMRQDAEFQPGEAVSQRHVAAAIARLVDAVVTVDPHLHRIASLDAVMPGCRTRTPSAAGVLGEWVAQRVERPLLLGPDEEAMQWVREAGRRFGFDHAVCRKERRGDRDVSVWLPECALQGRAVVLMDDVASTGRTLAAACRASLEAGAATVDVAVTHALFVGDAFAELQRAGVRQVWSTDTVPHPSALVPIAPLLADAVRSL
jgi:ribose-phosphate pyrophosphokinase